MSKHESKPGRKLKAAPRRGTEPATAPVEGSPATALSPLDALAAGKAEGRVRFDDRGNAVWEWAGAHAGAVDADRGADLPTRSARPGRTSLSLAEDAPSPADTVKANPLGVIKGYNPYDSGKLAKPDHPAAPRKKDLRKLSEWVQLRKQFEAKKEGED